MTLKPVLAILCSGLILAGCADAQNNPKQTAGTLIGAAAGGLLGAQFGSGAGQLAATAVGALGGAWLGNQIGSSLDDTDRLKAQQAHQNAMASGGTVRWDNPDSGNYGSVTPTRYGTDSQTGERCSEYQSEVVIEGQAEYMTGVACQGTDGVWRPRN